MVAYCPNTKRVWVGARNGHLALYELKQHAKCQVMVLSVFHFSIEYCDSGYISSKSGQQFVAMSLNTIEGECLFH